MLDCPKCSALAYDGTICTACGFSAAGGKAKGINLNQNRCTFAIGERRCRYVATIFEGQTRGAQHGVCGGHFRATPQSAAETLMQSERDTGTPDYSNAAQAAETLRRYEATDRYELSDVERRVNAEIPYPPDGIGDWWARRILRLHKLGHQLPAISVLIARQVVKSEAQSAVTSEDLLERAAIQSEA